MHIWLSKRMWGWARLSWMAVAAVLALAGCASGPTGSGVDSGFAESSCRQWFSDVDALVTEFKVNDAQDRKIEDSLSFGNRVSWRRFKTRPRKVTRRLMPGSSNFAHWAIKRMRWKLPTCQAALWVFCGHLSTILMFGQRRWRRHRRVQMHSIEKTVRLRRGASFFWPIPALQMIIRRRRDLLACTPSRVGLSAPASAAGNR